MQNVCLHFSLTAPSLKAIFRHSDNAKAFLAHDYNASKNRDIKKAQLPCILQVKGYNDVPSIKVDNQFDSCITLVKKGICGFQWPLASLKVAQHTAGES